MSVLEAITGGDVALSPGLYEEIIERERACGQSFGPFHRKWLTERSPEKVQRLLRLAAERPWLVGAQQGFPAPLANQGAQITSTAAINTTVTETNLWNPGIQAPINALDMSAGKVYTVEFGGVHGTTATPAISFRARCGTNNSAPPTGTDLGVGPTMTLGTFTAQPFHGRFVMVVRSVGIAAAGATVTGTGFVICAGAAAATTVATCVIGGAIPTTVDHTVAQGLSVSVIWGTSSASNTITCQWVFAQSQN